MLWLDFWFRLVNSAGSPAPEDVSETLFSYLSSVYYLLVYTLSCQLVGKGIGRETYLQFKAQF